MTGYPHELAAEPAPPPAPVGARVAAMAAKAHRKHLEATAGQLRAAGAGWPLNPRPAVALQILKDEANAAAPTRNRASDGMIGDARHQADPSSDHNGWLKVGGIGVVRAFDLTADRALDLPAAFERLRVAALEGRCPQLPGGGYLILNGRISAEDFTGWRTYTGADPHVSHGHVSVSRDPARFDSRAPWGAFTSEQAPAPAPVPVPAPPAPPAPAAGPGWTGPDLTGVGPGLRGDEGNNGPRVAAWQAWLNDTFPLYSHLAVDGWWGPATTAVNREFGQRSGIGSADGRNIGPKLAQAYARAGLFRTLSAARARVAGHRTRR